MVLMAYTTRPVQYLILPWLYVHSLDDRVYLFTVFMFVDDLVPLVNKTHKGILETRRVP
jgi:hypothetical protein